jgi:hypothetical protein
VGAERGQARREQAIIRFGTPLLLACSAVGAVLVSLHTAKAEIPSFAFGSHVVLAVQLTLLFFYGALLLLVPLVRAAADGELPIELSMRGARFAERELTDANEETFERLDAAEKSLATLSKEAARSDRVQKELGELHREVDALDARYRKATAVAKQRFLAATETLDGTEITE